MMRWRAGRLARRETRCTFLLSPGRSSRWNPHVARGPRGPRRNARKEGKKKKRKRVPCGRVVSQSLARKHARKHARTHARSRQASRYTYARHARRSHAVERSSARRTKEEKRGREGKEGRRERYNGSEVAVRGNTLRKPSSG